MIYVKIGETLYPATVNGRMTDTEWDRRASKSITVEMDYETASALFVDGLAWSIVMETTAEVEGETTTQTEEFDNADYCVAGTLTDNRDGTMTAKMGKLTELEEAYEMLLGGIE